MIIEDTTESTPTTMPGFTAINTPPPAVPAPKLDADPTAGEMVPGRRQDNKRRQPTRKQTAPSKDVNQTAPKESTRKRISGKGKKRTSHHGVEPEPKRRKSGSIESSMPNTKAAVNTTATVDSATIQNPCSFSTDAGLVSLTSKTKLDGFRYKSGQAQPQLTESALASYAPETSMDMVSRLAGGLLREGAWSPRSLTTLHICVSQEAVSLTYL